MKKNTVLYILLAFLIVVNGFFLFNHLGESKNNKEKENRDSMSFVKKELNFNEVQLEKLEHISEAHHHQIRRIDKDIRGLKEVLFNKMSSISVNERAVDSITTLIGKKQKAIEAERFFYFRNILEIGDDKQKEKFKEIIKNALHKEGRGDRPPPPNGSRHRPPPPDGPVGHRPPPDGF